MVQRIEQDNPASMTVARQSIGAHEDFSGQLASAANDNNCEGPWPLVPFPEGLFFPNEQHEPSESVTSHPVQESDRSYWRATLSRLAYAATVSIAMLGWLYLLGLALVSSVLGLL